jgi:hypothetical protein
MGSDCLARVWLLPRTVVRSMLFWRAKASRTAGHAWVEHGLQDLLELLKRHVSFLPLLAPEHRPTLRVANTRIRSWGAW